MACSCHPVSASEIFSHLETQLACFECSFGRSSAPDADSGCSWLPRGRVLPIIHAEKHVLLQAALAAGGCVLGAGCYSSMGAEVVPLPPEKGGNPCQAPARQDRGQPQPCRSMPRGGVCCVRGRGCPGGSKSLCLGQEPHQTFWAAVCMARCLELVLW